MDPDTIESTTVQHESVIQESTRYHRDKTFIQTKNIEHLLCFTTGTLFLILCGIFRVVYGLFGNNFYILHDYAMLASHMCLIIALSAVIYIFIKLSIPLVNRISYGGHFTTGILHEIPKTISVCFSLILVSQIIWHNAQLRCNNLVIETTVNNKEPNNSANIGSEPLTESSTVTTVLTPFSCEQIIQDINKNKKTVRKLESTKKNLPQNSIKKYYYLFINPDIYNDEHNDSKDIILNINEESIFAKTLHAIALSILIFITRSIIIYALNYNVYYAHYSERIEKNNDKTSVINALSSLANASYSNEIDAICTALLRIIALDEPDLVTFTDLKKLIGESNAIKVFKYCEKNVKESLDYGDFYNLYTSTLFEQEQLSRGLRQKNSAVKTLHFISTFICIPIAIAVFLNYKNIKSDHASRISIIMTGLISGGYVFGDIIKKMIMSLLFVFFVRPFDIHDYVRIGGKLYRVDEINVLTTNLMNNRLCVIMQNSKLLDEAITNYRISNVCEESYTFKFKIDEFRKYKEQLVANINNHIAKLPRVFRQKMYFKDNKIIDESTIDATIVIGYNIENISMKVFNENQENFVLNLHAMIANAGFTQYK